MKSVQLAAAAVLLAASFASAETDVERLRLGDFWFGAQIDTNDLVGKVVLVEYWGS